MFKVEKMAIEGMDMAKSWLEGELHCKKGMLSLYKNADEDIRKKFLSMITISVCIKADIVWWRDNYKDSLITDILENVDSAEHVFADEIKSNTFRAEYLNYLLMNNHHTKREQWHHMINYIKEGTQYEIVFRTDYAKVIEECENGMETIPAWYFNLPHLIDFKTFKNKKNENSLAEFAYIKDVLILYMDGKKDCSEKVKQEFKFTDKELSEIIMGYITDKEIVIYKGPSGKIVPLASFPVNMLDDISEIIDLYDLDHTQIAVLNGLGVKEPVGILHKSNFIF
ncbi:hypothetical protein [Hungatella hathewayi]|uniref:hypothetical protein n=1 Tax=Hungatella hathewayi TaxID=154046 RepID=UPI003569AE9E